MTNLHTSTKPRATAKGSGFVSRAEFNSLRARLEDIEDAFSVLRAKERGHEASDLPADQMRRLIKGESPLRVWREFRGMTLEQLSKAANVSKPYISEVESGKKPGSVVFYRKCAKALNVALDDLTKD